MLCAVSTMSDFLLIIRDVSIVVDIGGQSAVITDKRQISRQTIANMRSVSATREFVLLLRPVAGSRGALRIIATPKRTGCGAR